MPYVVFFRIYVQFPGNRNRLWCQNMSRYRYFFKKHSLHQSKNEYDGYIFKNKKFFGEKLRSHSDQKKNFGT